MMKKINKLVIYGLAISLFSTLNSCESPLKDFNLQVSTEVIKHNITLKVADPEGQNIPGVSISLASGDIQDIYNLNGKKEFKFIDNLITLGLTPNRIPNSERPIRFRVKLTANGYTSQTVPVAITDASSGIQTIILSKPLVIPVGVKELIDNLELDKKGSISKLTTINIPSAQGIGNMTMTIPSGTQFLDDAGNIITGNSLQVTVTNIDGNINEATRLLPGGTLRADQVILKDGRTASGTFSPIAVAKVKMLVNTTEVKKFSKAIMVQMPVSAKHISPISGETLTAGKSYQIFSYSADETWRYEQNSSVSGSAAKGYSINFPISHLSYFLAGEFGEACTSARVIKFSGDWMANGSTYPIQVDAIWGGKVIFSNQYSINQSNNSISLMDVPTNDVTFVVKNSSGRFLAEGALEPCGQSTNMILPNPGEVTEAISTLQLYVRCPNKTSVITLLPTFQMFYRISGTTNYKFLGTVGNGFLRTTLLKTDGTKYDFKAIWNDRIKIVNGKTVKKDNSATVGTLPGNLIGTMDGATNLAILKEECDKL